MMIILQPSPQPTSSQLVNLKAYQFEAQDLSAYEYELEQFELALYLNNQGGAN